MWLSLLADVSSFMCALWEHLNDQNAREASIRAAEWEYGWEIERERDFKPELNDPIRRQ